MPPPGRGRSARSADGETVGVVLALITIVAVVAYFAGPYIPGLASGAATSTSASPPPPPNDGPALLKAARTHDDESYVWGGGHPPTDYKKGTGLDCSGLVDVAVMDVTGIKKNLPARSFRNDSNWSKIEFKDAREGDIVYLLKENHAGHSDDHVGFVVSNDGDGKLTIFEAWTWQTKQPDQIRESSNRKYGEWDEALRFHR